MFQSSEPSDADGLFRSVRGSMAAVGGLSLLGAVAGVVPFIAIVELARTLWPALDDGSVDTGSVDAGRAWTIVGIAAFALLLNFAASGSSSLIGHLADGRFQLELRTRIVRHLQRLPLGWFDRRSSGAVKKAVENDVAALHQLVAHALQDFVAALAVPLVALVYLFAVEWRMALACCGVLVATVLLYMLMMRGWQEKYEEYGASVERLGSATIEYVHGIAVVKAFGQAGRSHRRYRDEADRFVGFYGGWMRETAVLQSVVEIVTSPVVVLVYLGGVSTALIGAGAATPLDVLPALVVGVGLMAPFLQLGASGQFLRNAVEAKQALVGFLGQETVPFPEQPVAPDGHGIEVAAASFSYDGEHEVIGEITASCAPGTVTALVGPSGSGKSTLARLVPRFYDVTSGAVSIGGADVRRIAAERLYGQVGFVFQDAHLLRTSIRDNIRLTSPDAAQEEVERAAKAAQIHDRILRLPRGYDSVVGQDAHLSGGEAQRLTIARALLTDAPILVLDEATAFADPDSEAAIQTALSALAAERTLLVIAHRLHTITGADQILVLDSGRVAERGTHAELAAAGGPYQEMWERYEQARTPVGEAAR